MTGHVAGFWIGHPGAMLALPDVQGDLNRAADRAVTYKTSASGHRRAYLSARRAPLREWKIALPLLQPHESAALHELLAETDPPYVWVDPWSLATNLLTPQASSLTSALPALSPTGRQPLEGGSYATTGAANPSAGLVRIEPAPVVPGMPVTVSAYLAGSGQARVAAQMLDSAGAAVGAPITSPGITGTEVLRRTSVTVLAPPQNVAAVEIRITGATVIARPAVTWTAELLEYGAGGGAAQVVVNGFDEAIQRAMRNASGQRYADLSFTLTEVN